MSDATRTEQEIKAAQAEMFRIAADEHDLTIPILSRETGIDLRSYNHGNIFQRAKMPLWVFVALCRVLPDDVTSIMLSPSGKHVASNEPVDGDESALARDAADYNVAYLHATDPASDRGPAISHVERAGLAKIHRRMKGRKVA